MAAVLRGGSPGTEASAFHIPPRSVAPVLLFPTPETRWTRVDLQAFTEPKDAKDAGVPCSHPGGPALVELGEVVQVCGVLDDKVHLEADGWTAV